MRSKMHEKLHLKELDVGMISMHTKTQRLGYAFQQIRDVRSKNAQSKLSLNMHIKMQKLKNAFRNAQSKYEFKNAQNKMNMHFKTH
jgi:hypothetical protein